MCHLPKLADSPFLKWKCRKRFIAWSTDAGESRGKGDSVAKRLKVLTALRYFCSVGALTLESWRKRPGSLVEASTRERAVARRVLLIFSETWRRARWRLRLARVVSAPSFSFEVGVLAEDREVVPEEGLSRFAFAAFFRSGES